MQAHGSLSRDQEYRGLFAEKRFFDNINGAHDVPLPGVINIAKASMVADVRGVDGVIRYRCEHGIRRIPIQIKHGSNAQMQCYIPTNFGFRVPVIYVTLMTSFPQMRRKVGELLACPDVMGFQYERNLATLEHKPPTSGEHEIICAMRTSQKELSRLRMEDFADPAFA